MKIVELITCQSGNSTFGHAPACRAEQPLHVSFSHLKQQRQNVILGLQTEQEEALRQRRQQKEGVQTENTRGACTPASIGTVLDICVVLINF